MSKAVNTFSISYYQKMLKVRNKIIKKNTSKNVNYFKIQEYFDFKRFNTYVIVTPRSIGKTYSGWETIIGFYEAAGEYSVWMRNSDMEVKEIVADYKTNRPAAWPEYAKIMGRQLIDDRNGNIICKFVALSTVGNLASITGDGCAMIYFDEFLPRNGKKPPANSYKVLTDFIKTLERDSMLIVCLTANLTTLNSPFITEWNLWIDKPIVDNIEKRLRWRYIKQWENPPKVSDVSTAAMWASNDDRLRKFMDEAEVLDNSAELVIPESRLGALRFYQVFLYDDVLFTLAYNDEDKLVIVEGNRNHYSDILVLSTLDGFKPMKNMIRPPSVNEAVAEIMFGLEESNLVFTSFTVKEAVFDLLRTLRGKITGR